MESSSVVWIVIVVEHHDIPPVRVPFTYLHPNPRNLLLCVPQKCNAEHLAKLFFWKQNVTFSSPNLLLRCRGWEDVFLRKVEALIKVRWNYFKIEE